MTTKYYVFSCHAMPLHDAIWLQTLTGGKVVNVTRYIICIGTYIVHIAVLFYSRSQAKLAHTVSLGTMSFPGTKKPFLFINNKQCIHGLASSIAKCECNYINLKVYAR